MTRKSVTIRAAWIVGILGIIGVIIAGIFTIFHNDGSNSRSQIFNITGQDSSKISVTSNQNEIKGDYINGNKVIITKDTQKNKSRPMISAPKALIVTTNQSGGNNTVNINQITSQSYQQISKEIADQVNENLTFLKNRYPKNPNVIIEIESGSSMRDKIARDLESFFITNKLGYYPKGNTYTGRFPEYPISVFTSKRNINFSYELLKAINPYIESKIFIDTSFKGDDFIRIYINGIPTFNANGKVVIE